MCCKQTRRGEYYLSPVHTIFSQRRDIVWNQFYKIKFVFSCVYNIIISQTRLFNFF